MIEHLEVRVHVASISLINETIIVRSAFDLFFDVEGNKNIRTNIWSLEFTDLIPLITDDFHSLFNDFSGHFTRWNPASFSPDNKHLTFFFFLIFFKVMQSTFNENRVLVSIYDFNLNQIRFNCNIGCLGHRCTLK